MQILMTNQTLCWHTYVSHPHNVIYFVLLAFDHACECCLASCQIYDFVFTFSRYIERWFALMSNTNA